METIDSKDALWATANAHSPCSVPPVDHAKPDAQLLPMCGSRVICVSSSFSKLFMTMTVRFPDRSHITAHPPLLARLLPPLGPPSSSSA